MVRIYSIPECPYCTELKKILTEEGITFEDINVAIPEHEEEYNDLHKITKSDDVPIVKIKKHILVPNVSFKSIKECVELVKKILNED